MKYVLGFLFEYKYYKNPANIKIFSNNQLIDEIDLTEDINMKNITPTLKEILTHKQMRKLVPSITNNKLPSGIDPRDIVSLRDTGILQIPKKVFVYTLDETILQNSIKIDNSYCAFTSETVTNAYFRPSLFDLSLTSKTDPHSLIFFKLSLTSISLNKLISCNLKNF